MELLKGLFELGTYRCSFNDSEDGTSIDSNTMIHLYVYDHVHLLTKDDFDFQQFVQVIFFVKSHFYVCNLFKSFVTLLMF